MAFSLDWCSYAITALIFLSIFIEGKQTRFPKFFFNSSIVLIFMLIIIGGANWWLNHSVYGLAIAGVSLYALLGTRFRMMIYFIRFRKLVANIGKAVSAGKRIILVLPEDEDERLVLKHQLFRSLPKNSFFSTAQPLGLSSSELIDSLSLCNDSKSGYLLACEGQLQARTWLKLVENDEPENSIAINFHLIPDLE